MRNSPSLLRFLVRTSAKAPVPFAWWWRRGDGVESVRDLKERVHSGADAIARREGDDAPCAPAFLTLVADAV